MSKQQPSQSPNAIRLQRFRERRKLELQKLRRYVISSAKKEQAEDPPIPTLTPEQHAAILAELNFD
jgi:hypothetical protein